MYARVRCHLDEFVESIRQTEDNMPPRRHVVAHAARDDEVRVLVVKKLAKIGSGFCLLSLPTFCAALAVYCC